MAALNTTLGAPHGRTVISRNHRMTRIITVGAAQLGPIARAESRSQVVERMLSLMHQAKGNVVATYGECV